MTVTVTFPRLYDATPLRNVAETVRAAGGKEFKQTPEDIVLAFSLGKYGAGTVAQWRGVDYLLGQVTAVMLAKAGVQ